MTYWRNKLAPQMQQPPGTARINGDVEKLAWRVCKDAAIFPEVSPVVRAVVWPEGVDEPALYTLAPTWLAIVTGMLMNAKLELDLDRRDQRHDGQEVDYDFQGVFGVLWQDTITLLQHFQTHPDTAVGLAAELDLVCRKEDHRGRPAYALEEAAVVVRRWATEAMHNM